MSDATLNLILQRLDVIERGQTERFDQIDLRFQQIDQRFERVEREQTRLRTDLLGQMERVLNAMQALREDMTVAMAYSARADAAMNATAAVQHALQAQLTRLRERVDRLEGKQDDAA
jgi:predicted transcriptional regulator